MANLMPGDVVNEVREVLRRVPTFPGYGPSFLTAYQILERLPDSTRDRLIAERGLGGRGAGVHYAAPSLISDAAGRLPGIEIGWIDSRGLSVALGGQVISPGYGNTAIYRIREEARPDV